MAERIAEDLIKERTYVMVSPPASWLNGVRVLVDFCFLYCFESVCIEDWP